MVEQHPVCTWKVAESKGHVARKPWNLPPRPWAMGAGDLWDPWDLLDWSMAWSWLFATRVSQRSCQAGLGSHSCPKNPSGTVVSHFLRCQRSSHEYLVHTSQWAEMMSALRTLWHFLERVFQSFADIKQRPGAVAAYTTIGWGGHVSPIDFQKNCRLMKSQSKEHLSICFILDDTRPTKSRKSRPF